MDIQDTSYRQIGVLFDGQFKYKLSPQQRVVLAGLTSMSLKGYSGSGNPVIKASDEEIVDSFIETVPLVDETLETVIIKKVEPSEAKSNTVEYEQLSLFSFIDDED